MCEFYFLQPHDCLEDSFENLPDFLAFEGILHLASFIEFIKQAQLCVFFHDIHTQYSSFFILCHEALFDLHKVVAGRVEFQKMDELLICFDVLYVAFADSVCLWLMHDPNKLEITGFLENWQDIELVFMVSHSFFFTVCAIHASYHFVHFQDKLLYFILVNLTQRIALFSHVQTSSLRRSNRSLWFNFAICTEISCLRGC